MKPLVLTAMNGKTTTNILRTFNIESIVSTKDTILGDNFIDNGATVNLPETVEGLFGPVDSIKLPPCPVHMDENIVILDDIAIRVNNLLRVIDLVKKAEKTKATLQKSVVNFQKTILTKLGGKAGIMWDILGKRLANTGRAVLLPYWGNNISHTHIPEKIRTELSISGGDVVIVGRDPTIWNGSIEVLVADDNVGGNDAIYIHPFVFNQLGADCDGDTVWVMKVPDKFQEEMRKHVLSFYFNHIKEVCRSSCGWRPLEIKYTSCIEPPRVFYSNGFSIGPEDIIKQDEVLNDFKKATGKDISKEAAKIANGLTRQEYIDYLLSVNETMLVQKIYLGPVGAAAQKLKLIAGDIPHLRESANYLSERIQQMLFDVKAIVTEDKKDLEIFFEILDIVNMANDWSSTETLVTNDEAIDRLVSFGLDKEKIYPIISLLYTIYPLYIGSVEVATKLKILTSENIEKITDICFRQVRFVNLPKALNDLCDVLVGAQRIDIIMATRKVKKSNTLSNMLNDPLYNIMNPFSDEKLYHAIVTLRNSLENKDKKPKLFRRLTETILNQSLEGEHDRQRSPRKQISTTWRDSEDQSGRRGIELSNLQDLSRLDELKAERDDVPVPSGSTND